MFLSIRATYTGSIEVDLFLLAMNLMTSRDLVDLFRTRTTFPKAPVPRTEMAV